MTKFKLDGEYVDFDKKNKCFQMKKNPYYNSRHNYKRFGKVYYLDKNAKLDKRYRFKCSLAQTILFEFTNEIIWRYGNVCFDLSDFKGKFSNSKHLKNQSGYLSLYNLSVYYKNRYENKLIFARYCDNGEILDQKQMQKVFRLLSLL